MIKKQKKTKSKYEENRVVVSISISKDLNYKIIQIAAKNNRSKSNQIATILENFFKQKEIEKNAN